jgi:hypothetical protein
MATKILKADCHWLNVRMGLGLECEVIARAGLLSSSCEKVTDSFWSLWSELSSDISTNSSLQIFCFIFLGTWLAKGMEALINFGPSGACRGCGSPCRREVSVVSTMSSPPMFIATRPASAAGTTSSASAAVVTGFTRKPPCCSCFMTSATTAAVFT